MPGISVTTGVRVGANGAAGVAPASTLFVVGTAERGPLDRAKVVAGMAQFESIYGGYTSNTSLYDTVKTFFEEGGTRVAVARVGGPGTKTAASVDVVDSADDVVFTLTAANAGEWANSAVSPAKAGLKAVVTVDTGTVYVEISYKNSVVWSAGPFQDELQQDATTKKAKTFIVEAINADPALADLVSATAGVSDLSPVADDYLLTGGDDDVANVTTTEIVAGLNLFDYDLGAGAVAAPGYNGSTIWAALRDHAKANRRIALCAFATGTTSSAAVTAAKTYWGTTAASRNDGSYMAFYWPSVTVPDGQGGTRAISPEGFAAAKRAKAHLVAGPWRVGAGEIASAAYVKDTYVPVTRTVGQTLDDARINAIRTMNGSVRIYGARSVSADDLNWRFITYRDTLNYITALAEQALEPLVFSPIDGRGTLFASVESRLVGILEPIRVASGLYEGVDQATGALVDPGYSVQVGRANNSEASLATGTVNAVVGVRVSPVADKVNITITKSSLSVTV